MSQAIGMISSYQGIDIFIYIWVVVPYDKLLSITVLSEYDSLLRAVKILFTHSDSMVEYFVGRLCLVMFV